MINSVDGAATSMLDRLVGHIDRPISCDTGITIEHDSIDYLGYKDASASTSYGRSSFVGQIFDRGATFAHVYRDGEVSFVDDAHVIVNCGFARVWGTGRRTLGN